MQQMELGIMMTVIVIMAMMLEMIAKAMAEDRGVDKDR